MLRIGAGLLAGCALSACGGRAIGGESGAQEGEGESGEVSTDASGSGESGDAESGESGTEGTTGGEECPLPGLSPKFSLDLVEEHEPVDLDWTCTVLGSATQGPDYWLTLSCLDFDIFVEVVVTVSAEPTLSLSLSLAADDEVRLRWMQDGPWWINRWFRIDRGDGSHLVSGIDGDSLGLAFADETPALPYETTAVPGLCPIFDSCGPTEPLGLSMTVGEADELVYPYSHELIGGIPGVDVWVGASERHLELECTDTPTDWYQVVVAHPGDE